VLLAVQQRNSTNGGGAMNDYIFFMNNDAK
jgi:hypothetical protein